MRVLAGGYTSLNIHPLTQNRISGMSEVGSRKETPPTSCLPMGGYAWISKDLSDLCAGCQSEALKT